MRALSSGSTFRTSQALGQVVAPLVAAVALLAGSGCAKRLTLQPKELERVQTEAGVQPLRVYPSHKLISIYDEAEISEQFDVNRTIQQTTAKERLKNVVTKNTAGLILKIEERNGMPLLWVTFEPDCTETDCSFAFVEAEDGIYRFTEAPKRAGYRDPKNYRSCEKKFRRLKLGKMKSLAEANDVFLVKKKNGKILTIDLQVKKVVDDRTRTRTRRSRGIQ